MYSELISSAIGSGGPHAARTSQVKLMRSVKKVALRLIETFVDKAEDTQVVAQQFVPAMMDPILGDYARNVPDARWAPLGPMDPQLHCMHHWKHVLRVTVDPVLGDCACDVPDAGWGQLLGVARTGTPPFPLHARPEDTTCHSQ